MTPDEKRIEEIRGNLPEKGIGEHTIFGDARFLLSQLDAVQKLADERLEALRPVAERCKPDLDRDAYYRLGVLVKFTIAQIYEAKRLVDQANEEDG